MKYLYKIVNERGVSQNNKIEWI